MHIFTSKAIFALVKFIKICRETWLSDKEYNIHKLDTLDSIFVILNDFSLMLNLLFQEVLLIEYIATMLSSTVSVKEQ